MVIYGDVVFVLNLLINYTLLRGTARLGAHAAAPLRLWLGAGIGGLYALLTFVPGLEVLQSTWVKFPVAVLMPVCAFGTGRSTLRLGGIFALLSLVLCGAVFTALSLQGKALQQGGYLLYPVSFPSLILTAFAVCLACRMLLPPLDHSADSILPLSVCLKGKSVRLTALRDTGNSLSDPLTGAPVITVYWKALHPLLPKALNEQILHTPERSMELLRSFSPRLIPYRAVGTAKGLLLAIPCTVTSGSKPRTQLVALSPTPVSDGGAYEALIGGNFHA